ncbi:MAG: acyl-CoA dehydrogenase family protein [Pseudonocardiaceae bacterium]
MADHARAQRVAARFADLVAQGRLEVPLPGGGGTAQRWRALAELATDDLDVARLAEAHLDATAILHELGGAAPDQSMPQVRPGQRWAVWAAEPPNGRVDAEHCSGGGWRLTGIKRWCSGAHACTHALLTAHAAGGSRLFALDLSHGGVHPALGGWKGLGMAGSGTEDVQLAAVPAVAIGAPRAYLDRVGFWYGAIGVAACWYGGAVAVGRPLWQAARNGNLDPHARAHLGAIDSVLAAAAAVLQEAAATADRAGDPAASDATSVQLWRRRALQVRAIVEAAATTTMERVGRALGPRPLATDAAHSRRITDLAVYLRQSHAERDLAVLGDLAAGVDRWQLW